MEVMTRSALVSEMAVGYNLDLPGSDTGIPSGSAEGLKDL